MKTACLLFLMMIWAPLMQGTSYGVPSSSNFSPRVWKGMASQAVEKPTTFVILSEANDLGSSPESVTRANYRGSSPEMWAQNDSAGRRMGGKATDEYRDHGRTFKTNHPPSHASLTKANHPKPLPNSRQRSLPGNALHRSGSNISAGPAKGGLIQGETVHNALPVGMSSVARPTAPPLSNLHHRSPNPAVVGGSTSLRSGNAGVIDGTRLKRKR